MLVEFIHFGFMKMFDQIYVLNQMSWLSVETDKQYIPVKQKRVYKP